MKTSRINSAIINLPAWIASIVTSISSLFLPFIFVGIVSLLGLVLGISNEMLGNFIAYLCTGISVAIICFLICKAHPKSFWYTVIICNAITLWAGLGNYYLQGSPFINEALPFGIGWVLSIIGVVWVRFLGRHKIIPSKTH